MAMTYDDISTALANDARRQEMRQKVANLRGQADATASLLQRISSLNNDTLLQLQSAQDTLTAFENGAAPGVTVDFGPKSTITQMMETERWAAKSAVIDYVKANPTCLEADAVTQWTNAALASHTSFTQVLQDGLVMSALYRQNLLAAGLITTNTWEAHRDWIVATPKDTIMGL